MIILLYYADRQRQLPVQLLWGQDSLHHSSEFCYVRVVLLGQGCCSLTKYRTGFEVISFYYVRHPVHAIHFLSFILFCKHLSCTFGELVSLYTKSLILFFQVPKNHSYIFLLTTVKKVRTSLVLDVCLSLKSYLAYTYTLHCSGSHQYCKMCIAYGTWCTTRQHPVDNVDVLWTRCDWGKRKHEVRLHLCPDFEEGEPTIVPMCNDCATYMRDGNQGQLARLTEVGQLAFDQAGLRGLGAYPTMTNTHIMNSPPWFEELDRVMQAEAAWQAQQAQNQQQYYADNFLLQRTWDRRNEAEFYDAIMRARGRI